jgi:hypothetical protein
MIIIKALKSVLRYYLQHLNCSRPARENVMNAHGETRLFLVVVNQLKIQ